MTLVFILELMPDEEEKQLLENNIQVALQRDQIYLEDAIDIREIKNIKLANQLLKVRRKRKAAEDRAMQMENIQAQSESNARGSSVCCCGNAKRTSAYRKQSHNLKK
jgi:diaminopimelate epimerase